MSIIYCGLFIAASFINGVCTLDATDHFFLSKTLSIPIIQINL